jgi:type IV pilus biogenesis protein CpaD/CtpE
MKGMQGFAAVLLLAGCKLIDQTTFAPSPEATPAAEQMAKVDARTALLTINYTEPSPSYRDVLRYAVRTAETRAPGVQYDVIAILPSGADAAAAQQRAAEVMRSIMDQGVSDSRIHLGLRSAPASSPQEIRVYVK